MYIEHCTVYSFLCTLYFVQCTVSSVDVWNAMFSSQAKVKVGLIDDHPPPLSGTTLQSLNIGQNSQTRIAAQYCMTKCIPANFP